MYPIEPAISEPWEYGDTFPDTIDIDGTTFYRAIRQQPYDGVIAQYRQNVPRDSMHLLVTDDGRWIIDHVDEYNPDMGHPVRHFIIDHPAGKSLLVAGIGLLGVGGAAVFGAMQESERAKKTNGSNPGESDSGSG